MIKHLSATIVAFLLLVSATSFSQKPILLENRSWTPKALLLDDELKFSSEEVVADEAIRLMQFEQIPSVEVKSQLREKGVKLLSYIPNLTYVVKMPTSIVIDNLMTWGVVSVEHLPIEAKLSKDIHNGDIGEWALKGSNAYITVQYWKGTVLTDLTAALQGQNVTILGQYPEYRLIDAVTDINNLYALSKITDIEYVSLISEPGEPEDLEGRTLHRSNRINTQSDVGLKYNAEGVGVLVRDDGVVGPHIDFKGRLDNLQTAGFVNIDHADGVAGILGGSGNLNPKNQGMASASDVYVVNYQANFRDNTLDLHLQNGVMVTNSSYSNGCNDGYTTITQTVDRQIEENPTFLHVFSAGNSGTLDCGYGAGNRWGNVTGGHKIGKNVIATANLRYDVSLENSSSRGPASDGRLKPDISARGTNQVSTDPNNLYAPFGGTSAASPGVAGVSAQLYHAYREMNGGNDPESALIKAALMNTANDLGNVGPDFQFGWGHLNAWRAYQLLKDERYITSAIGNGETNEHTFSVPDGTTELRVMLYWREPAASPSARIALVNDLDLTVEDEMGNVHMPWLLDPTPNATTLALPAGNGRDSLNNVEQVFFTMPESGTYTVKVNGTTIPFGTREYYVLYEMKDSDIEITYPVGGEGFAPGEAEQIHWDASEGVESFLLEYSTNDGGTWTEMGTASGTQRTYVWTVPEVVSSKCKVRITRETSVTESPEAFSIVDVPVGLKVVKVCPDYIALNWNAVEGAEGYDLYLLGEKFMEIIGNSDTNYIEVAVPDVLDDMWFSVRATGADGLIGRRAIAYNYSGGLSKCLATVDVSLERVFSPNENLVYSCGAFNEPVVVEIKNNGQNIVDEVSISYQLDGGNVQSETFSVGLSPDETEIITLMDNLSIPTAGNHLVSVWIEVDQDELIGNDRADLPIEVRPFNTSAALDYSEDFQLPVFPPDQWVIESEVNATGWQQSQVIGPAGTGTRCMSIGNDESIEIFYEDAIYTEAIDLKNATSPVLFFDYAYNLDINSNYPGGFKVVVFSFCGNRQVVELLNRNGSGFNTTSTNNQFPWTPSSGDDWRKIGFDLKEFIGSEIVIGFIVENGFDYNLYVDNINIEESNIKFPTSNFTISNTTPCALFETVEIVSTDDDPDFEYNFVFGEFSVPKTASGAGPHIIRFLRTGQYEVSLEVSDPNTGAFISKSLPVEVFSVPSSNFAFDINNYEVQFTNRSNNATSYEWDFGDGESSTEENPLHEYDLPGSYNVQLYATNQCSTRVRMTEITVGTVSNKDLTSAALQVYPNPTTGMINLRTIDLQSENLRYALIDLRGVEVLRGALSQGVDNQIDLGDMSSGLYFLKVIGDDQLINTAKVVIE